MDWSSPENGFFAKCQPSGRYEVPLRHGDHRILVGPHKAHMIRAKRHWEKQVTLTRVSAAFALLAALLWLVSALWPIPRAFPIYTVQALGGPGTGHSPALAALARALKRQSAFSAAAALCAAVSAGLQGIDLFKP